jgi:hypothetical protein
VWAASSSGVGLAPRTGEANGDGSLWGLHGRMWPLLRCRRRLENKPLAPGQRHDIEDHAAGREKARHRVTGRILCAFIHVAHSLLRFVPCHTEARNRRRGTRTRRRSESARRRQMQPTSSVAGRVEKCVVERLWPQSRSSCVRCLLAFRAYPLSAWESCESKLLP